MKTLSILLICFTAVNYAVYGQSTIYIDGNPYSDGQTIYLECGKTSVSAGIPPAYDANNQEIYVYWYTNGNLSTTPSNVASVVTLNLDPNKNDGDIGAAYYANGATSPGITVHIKQKPPVPSFTSTPSLCGIGSSVVFSASDNYLFQNTKPISLVWQTSGGVTVNGNSSYTQNNSTSSSVNVGLNSRGLVSVYATIPGCNNIQSASATPVYVGSPQITDVTIDNTVNPGPYPVASGSTHYLSTASAYNYLPSYSLSTSTNAGNLQLSLSGVNNGNCQIYAYGSIGNASVNITASNSCGSDTRYVTFYVPTSYSASPNPARNNLTINFSDASEEYALPDKLEIIAEKDMKVVRSCNVQGTFKKNAFKNGNEVEFAIDDLPRGTYYLRVSNPRQVKEKQVEMTRLVFE